MDNILVIDGIKIETHWHGPPPTDAPTLILLHEGLGCAATWKDFPQALSAATECGVMVFSRYGYGRSDLKPAPWPLTYLHDEGLDMLPKIIQAAGIKEHFLIGHSDGGSIALINAGGAPQPGLIGLITEAAHVFNEELCHQSIIETRENYRRGRLRAGLEKYHGDKVDDVFWGWCRAWLHEDWWEWNLEPYLPKIKVPILVMQGIDDPYGTQAQVTAIAGQVKGGAEICLLPNCSHTPHREQRDKTFKAMTTFIQQTLFEYQISG